MEQIIAEEEKVQKVQADHSEMVDILIMSRFISSLNAKWLSPLLDALSNRLRYAQTLV
jgi:hypothetical protein